MARVVAPVHDGTFTSMMEQLQVAYVEAVAATAGCTMNVMNRDTFALDALIVRHRDNEDETHLWVQLKNTTTVPVAQDGEFTFKFKHARQLDRLRRRAGGSPVLLLVMVSPPSQASWTHGTHDALTIHHCCYWKNVAIAGQDETRSDLSVRVSRLQVFDAPSLLSIMDRIERGEQP